MNAPSNDYEGYINRIRALESLFGDLLTKLQDENDYGQDAVGRAFIRRNDEPGRAWNMDEWNKRYKRRMI